jgi:hypothetical protein
LLLAPYNHGGDDLVSLWLVTSRLHSYLLRVLPANIKSIAGTKYLCPGTRMARSYKKSHNDDSALAQRVGPPAGSTRDSLKTQKSLSGISSACCVTVIAAMDLKTKLRGRPRLDSRLISQEINHAE